MAPIPYRLKAGLGVGKRGSTDGHHHRSTTKVSHKPFKTRHATKTELKRLAKGEIWDNFDVLLLTVQGKVHKSRSSEAGKSRQVPVMSKQDRKNRSHQKQQTKQQQHARSTQLFAGQQGAPRIVAVVPLSGDVNVADAILKLNASVDVEDPLPSNGPCTFRIDRFRQSIQYLMCTQGLFESLDACRAADYIVLAMCASQKDDPKVAMLLKAIESQGISNVTTVVSGLDTVKRGKPQQDILSCIKDYVSRFFPEQAKLHSLDSRAECANVVRSILTSTPKGIRWREDRAWMLVEEVEWGPATADHASAVLTGFLRGAPLSANRLLHVGDWGCFQIDKVEAAPRNQDRKRKADEMTVDSSELEVLAMPDANQEDPAEVAPEEIFMENEDADAFSTQARHQKGVLIDDGHYFSEEEAPESERPHKLPRGTSSYQAAWYLDGMSDSGSDWEDAAEGNGDVEMEGPPNGEADIIDTASQTDPTEATPSEYPPSEMFLDPTPQDEAQELAAYRARREKDVAEDLEFPDEIELHPDVPARERLARYRGLKSVRTSPWDTRYDADHEPPSWHRLLQIPSYRAAKKRATAPPADGVPAGTRVRIRLRDVPIAHRTAARADAALAPLAAFALHLHEQKLTVMHFRIALDSAHDGALKAKDELFLQCGPRRLTINPLFSDAGATPNDVHRYARYLHPGTTAVATAIAPLSWGDVPVLFFRRVPSLRNGIGAGR